MPTLTVFTPAYNRAHTIGRTYESLCRQTCQDFDWVIIDDGSSDNTRELVYSWLNKPTTNEATNRFDGYSKDCPWLHVQYCYKANGGLFTGYNKALELMNNELCVCIDSDDFMPDDAVEIIISTWKKVKNQQLAGLIGLDYYLNGEPIGGPFTRETAIYFHEQKYLLNHRGDTKIVCRTKLMKEFAPMPSYGEKNFNPVWYYLKVGETKKFYALNKNLCFVDYQSDGMAAGIYKQFIDSPRSFAELRRVYMTSKHLPLKRKFVDAAHYVSSSIFSRDTKFIKNSPKPLLTIAAIPLGIIIHAIILFKLHKRQK
jgi:glycosyltransferase involved in cell wall biosynthesis